MRSRLPAPPPQCLSMRRRVARTIERRTLPGVPGVLHSERQKRRRSPKGGPRRSDRARPGCLPCARDGSQQNKRSDKGIISGPSKRGRPPLTPCAPSPDGEGGGKGEAPARARAAGEGKKEGPPKGPRAISRALHLILYHTTPRKSRTKSTSPPARGERPQRGRRPAPRRGTGEPAPPGAGPAPGATGRDSAGGDPRNAGPPRGPKRPRGRDGAGRRGRGKRGRAQQRKGDRSPAKGARRRAETGPVNRYRRGGGATTRRGLLERRGGRARARQREAPEPEQREGRTTKRARSPLRPRDGDGDKTRGGGPRGEGDGTGPPWRNYGGSGGDQRRHRPTQGAAAGRAEGRRPAAGEPIKPDALARGRRGGVPPEGP